MDFAATARNRRSVWLWPSGPLHHVGDVPELPVHEVKITVPVQQQHHLSVLVMPGLSRGAEAPVLEEDHRSAS